MNTLSHQVPVDPNIQTQETLSHTLSLTHSLTGTCIFYFPRKSRYTYTHNPNQRHRKPTTLQKASFPHEHYRFCYISIPHSPSLGNHESTTLNIYQISSPFNHESWPLRKRKKNKEREKLHQTPPHALNLNLQKNIPPLPPLR